MENSADGNETGRSTVWEVMLMCNVETPVDITWKTNDYFLSLSLPPSSFWINNTIAFLLLQKEKT